MVDAVRQIAVSAHAFKHLLRRHAKGVVHVIVELAQLDALLLDQLFKRRAALRGVFRHHDVVLGGGSRFNDELISLGQPVPPLRVHSERQHCPRLVEARVVVVLGGFVELHEAVVPRSHPLGGVDGAGHEVFVNLPAGQGDRRPTQFRNDIAAKARDTHLQAFKVVGGIDLLAEPAAHLNARVTGHQALQAKCAGQLVPEFLAAAEADPRVRFRVGQAERNGGIVCPAQMLALPVVIGGVVRLRFAVGNFVESVERTDALSRCKVFYVNAAIGHGVDTFRQTLCAGPKSRKIARPSRDHDHIGALLRYGRRRESGHTGCAGNTGHASLL